MTKAESLATSRLRRFTVVQERAVGVSLNRLRQRIAWSWSALIIRTTVVVAALVLTFTSRPGPGVHGRNLVISIALAVIIAGGLVWLAARFRYSGEPVEIGALVVLAGACGVLADLTDGAAAAIGAFVTLLATAAMGIRTSVGLLVVGVASALVTLAVIGGSALTYCGVIAVLWLTGLTRRSYRMRAEDAEQALATTRRAAAAEQQAAALGERARIAREVHDILAHSLSALSLTLGAVEGMLASESLPDDNPQLEEARRSVVRAGQLARTGLAETRLAITALREDLRPLPELVRELAGAQGRGGVSITITGTPTTLSPDRALTAYRTVQEALTNARKHAPNEPVDVHLDYATSGLDLAVINPLPVAAAERPLTATGAGYGLAGLAERAALANGVLTAGPAGDSWRVHLTIPA